MNRVEVRWLDSISVGDQWLPARKTRPAPRAMRHTTVGFLAVDHRDFIVVCASRQDVSTNVIGCIVIPRRAITRLRRGK